MYLTDPQFIYSTTGYEALRTGFWITGQLTNYDSSTEYNRQFDEYMLNL